MMNTRNFGDHCMGLFSAFNVDAIGHLDVYTSSVPARYDGRLSSYLDVRTKNGSLERCNGSFRLGLAALGISLNGPIGKKTTYSLAVRRTWSEALTLPIMGLIRLAGEQKFKIGYSFIDMTGKVSHAFNDRTIGFVSIYYGDDWFYGGESHDDYYRSMAKKEDSYDLRWGNIIAQTGLRRIVSDELSAEFSMAYSRFFSAMKQDSFTEPRDGEPSNMRLRERRGNSIGDAESVMGGYEMLGMFFTDDMFSGSGYTVSLRFYGADFEASGREFEEAILDCGIKFKLMCVSESYYNHMNYLWQKNSGVIGSLSDLGLSDPICGYSYVSTGAGVVAAKAIATYDLNLKDFLRKAINDVKEK